MNNAIHYEYNIDKAYWLMNNGCVVIGTGKGNRGDRYFKFNVSKKMKLACEYYDTNINKKSD